MDFSKLDFAFSYWKFEGLRSQWMHCQVIELSFCKYTNQFCGWCIQLRNSDAKVRLYLISQMELFWKSWELFFLALWNLIFSVLIYTWFCLFLCRFEFESSSLSPRDLFTPSYPSLSSLCCPPAPPSQENESRLCLLT